MSGEKVFVEARWVKNIMRNTFEYYLSGYFNPVKVDDRKPEISLKTEQAHKLVKFMQEEGYFPKFVDESIRKDDLKITHRLLDIIEKD